MIRKIASLVAGSLLALLVGGVAAPARAQEPAYLADRGDGIRTSLLATYIRPKEFVFYPFYEYTRKKNFEYKPSDLGYVGETDFGGGRKTEREFLVYLGYAFNDSLMIEFESALSNKAEFRKAANDTSAVPAQINESGLGDTEAQIRWRFAKETETRPDITFFFETVFPLQKKKKLIGTQAWDFVTGTVVSKGYSFGTLSLRASVAYDRADRQVRFAEYGIDYLKKLSPEWRVALTLEGESTDLSVIGEVQYELSKNATLKLNSGFGITKKDRVLAPEIGVLFRF